MRNLRAVLPALAAAACAAQGQFSHGSFGRNFPQAAISGFVLDTTSAEDVQAVLGPPMKTTTLKQLVPATAKSLVPASQISVTVLNYYYFPYGVGMPPQAHPGKFAVLSFIDGHLVFYGAGSSIPGEENRPVDEARLASLHQCESTKSDVRALLGPPNAEALHLLDGQPGAVEMLYNWGVIEAGATVRKSLTVFFDRTGEMSNYRLVNDVSAPNSLPFNATPATRLPAPCPGHGPREHT